MDRSPLGLPLPDVRVGRQHIPTLDEMAREVGASRGANEVGHLCPDCGGDLASGVIHVQICTTCGGVGRISDTRMVLLFGVDGQRTRPV